MEGQIIKLKEAWRQMQQGGIYHNIEFHKIEKETIDMVSKLKTDLIKPKHLHYNNIMRWYEENKDELNKI